MPRDYSSVRGKPNKTCEVCGAAFHVKPSHLAERRCCSRACSREWRRVRMSGTGNHQYGLRGELNCSWKGGRRVSSYGYILVHMPEHPHANGDGCVFEHRLVMERRLGRHLTRDEVVHHINEDKRDNRIENLELTTLGAHTAMHNREAPMPRDVTSGRLLSRETRA